MPKLTSQAKQFIRPYIEMEHSNEEASSLINEFLSIQQEEGPTPFEDVDSLGKAIQSYFFEDISPVFNSHLKAGITQFDPNPLLESEPYFNALKGLCQTHKEISLSWKQVQSYELYPYSNGNVHSKDFYRETPSFAYSKVPFSYPEFKKGGRPWMSLVPHELFTMKEPIKEAKGNVLTFGLGMGYFAYEASRKEEVRSLTIIEEDPDVIAFFSSYLASLFPLEKIRIIQGDAIRFAKESKERFDYLFSDINHDAEDGLPLYIKLKQSEGIASVNRYWIEEDILTYLRRYLIAFFEEQCDEKIQKLGEKAYTEEGDFASALFASFYRIFKDEEISSKKQFDNLLSDEYLKKLVKVLNIH